MHSLIHNALLVLIISLALFAPSTAAINYVTVNSTSGSALLPASSAADSVVMEAGDFQLQVQSWNSALSPTGYLCMAGVKDTKVQPGSTVWAANDALAVGHRCQLRLSTSGLSLINMDDNGAAPDWSTPAFQNVANLSLLESGNLILQDASGEVLWQSFEQATVFSILPGMKLSTNSTLYTTDVNSDISGSGDDWSTAPGTYALRLHENGTLYVYLSRGAARVDSIVQQNPAAGYVYWSYNVYGNSSQQQNTKVSSMSLGQNSSVFQFYDAQSQLIAGVDSLPATAPSITNSSSTNDSKIAVIERTGGYLTVFDYVLTDAESNTRKWMSAYNASATADTLCQIFSTASSRGCGAFSLCNVTDGRCYCPDGFSLSSSGDCQQANEPDCNTSSNSYTYLRVANVVFHPQLPPLPTATSETQCSGFCSQNCNCTAALYDPAASTCALFSSVRSLPTHKVASNNDQVLLVKTVVSTSKKSQALVSAAVVVVLGFCGGAAMWVLQSRRRRTKAEGGGDFDVEFLEMMTRLPPRFTLKEMEVATQGYSVKLGAGGFGAVYEGVLASGMKVAVKKLEGAGGHSANSADTYGQTFRAELVSISAASHVNLVTLKGFCIEAGSSLLVYEFMSNGSLDRWLFSKSVDDHKMELGWERRCAIALDTAKGLAYLHHECAERIVHCDIKPENILLDEKFRAKVADFGLAKLMEAEKQGFTMTTVKGTRGYLAPEWLQDSTITTKSDVYSYGVVLLELISGRRCLDGGYLPVVAMKALANSASSNGTTADQVLCRSGVLSVVNSLVDKRLLKAPQITTEKDDQPLIESAIAEADRDDGDVKAKAMERMMAVALWCVQTDPSLRPSMATVVQMLVGVQDVPPPPLRSATGERMIFVGDIISDDEGVLGLGSSEATSAAPAQPREWSLHPR